MYENQQSAKGKAHIILFLSKLSTNTKLLFIIATFAFHSREHSHSRIQHTIDIFEWSRRNCAHTRCLFIEQCRVSIFFLPLHVLLFFSPIVLVCYYLAASNDEVGVTFLLHAKIFATHISCVYLSYICDYFLLGWLNTDLWTQTFMLLINNINKHFFFSHWLIVGVTLKSIPNWQMNRIIHLNNAPSRAYFALVLLCVRVPNI